MKTWDVTIAESISENIPLILACVAGFLSLLTVVRRRTREGNRGNRLSLQGTSSRGNAAQGVPKGDDVLTSFRKKSFEGSKICITWEVVGSGVSWKDHGEEMIKKLAVMTPELFILIRVRNTEEKKQLLQLLHGLSNLGVQRNQVLFCTSEKGYEAFTRQVSPRLLITHDTAAAKFLERILEYILVVGCPEDQFTGHTLRSVPSLSHLIQIS